MSESKSLENMDTAYLGKNFTVTVPEFPVELFDALIAIESYFVDGCKSWACLFSRWTQKSLHPA
jgi:hypothetical protein